MLFYRRSGLGESRWNIPQLKFIVELEFQMDWVIHDMRGIRIRLWIAHNSIVPSLTVIRRKGEASWNIFHIRNLVWFPLQSCRLQAKEFMRFPSIQEGEVKVFFKWMNKIWHTSNISFCPFSVDEKLFFFLPSKVLARRKRWNQPFEFQDECFVFFRISNDEGMMILLCFSCIKIFPAAVDGGVSESFGSALSEKMWDE